MDLMKKLWILFEQEKQDKKGKRVRFYKYGSKINKLEKIREKNYNKNYKKKNKKEKASHSENIHYKKYLEIKKNAGCFSDYYRYSTSFYDCQYHKINKQDNDRYKNFNECFVTEIYENGTIVAVESVPKDRASSSTYYVLKDRLIYAHQAKKIIENREEKRKQKKEFKNFLNKKNLTKKYFEDFKFDIGDLLKCQKTGKIYQVEKIKDFAVGYKHFEKIIVISNEVKNYFFDDKFKLNYGYGVIK